MSNDNQRQAAPVAAQPAMPKLPSTPEEVVAFIGSHFDNMRDADDLANVKFQVSIHDLMSCFRDWFDLDEVGGQPAQPVEAPRQPAPELREILRDSLASGLTQTYGCSRVWSAWNVGTMTHDDFYPASECDEILDELCDLAIAVLGAPQTAAQPSDDVALKAKRYDWLRDSPDSGACLRAMYEDGFAIPEFVDEMIDTAMAQEKA